MSKLMLSRPAPLDSIIRAQVISRVELLDSNRLAIMETLDNGLFPPGRRVQIQVAYCLLVLEHQKAIAYLFEANLFSSAFSLARPVFEALVKGLWLFYCANDEQVESHAQGKEIDDITKAINDLFISEKIPKPISQSLKDVKSKYWRTLSSLTHMGRSQIINWLKSNGVEPNHSEDALNELANFVAFMSIVAGHELALRCNNIEGAITLFNKLPMPNES